MNRWKGISLFAGLAAAVALFLLSAGALTPDQRTAAALLVLMAVWWMTEAIPIHWTSLLPLLIIPLFSITDGGFVANARAAIEPYGQKTIFLFLGGMFLSAAMQRHNLHRRIALVVMNAVGGGRDKILLGFIAATAFISLWISNTATAVMMVPIGLSVIRQLEEQAGRRLLFTGQAFMLAIAYAANVGGIGTKIGTAPNAQFAGFVQKRYGVPMDFLDYLTIGLPFVLLFLPIVWLLLRRISAKDGALPVGSGDIARRELNALGKMTLAERWTLILFVAACALWIGGKPAGEALGLAGESYDAVVAMTVTIALFLIPAGGAFLIDRSSLRMISWSALILLGGSFALANAVQVSGLSRWFGGHLHHLMTLDPLLLMLVISVLTVVLSAFTSNTATCAVLLVVVADTFPVGDALPYLAAVTIASSCDFMLPCGTPPNAVVFATGHVRMSRMVRTGALLDLLAAVAVALWAHFGIRAMM